MSDKKKMRLGWVIFVAYKETEKDKIGIILI